MGVATSNRTLKSILATLAGLRSTTRAAFLGIPSFHSAEGQGKLGFIISVDRIKEWFGTALKSGLPKTTEQLATAFADSNLNLTGENLAQLNKYPSIFSFKVVCGRVSYIKG